MNRHLIAKFCMLTGTLGLIVVSANYLDAWHGSRQAVAVFAEAPAAAGDTLAVLRVPRLGLEVPVFEGTDARTLNRGAGVVDGTALPGETGHVAISAHRDSFFRPLQEIEVGDLVELSSSTGLQRFRVADIFITDPLDVDVLAPTSRSLLTLITCYPFRYIGFAPDRYIVRAEIIPTET